MKEGSTRKRRRRREKIHSECEKAGGIAMNQNTISDRSVADAADYLRKRRRRKEGRKLSKRNGAEKKKLGSVVAEK